MMTESLMQPNLAQTEPMLGLQPETVADTEKLDLYTQEELRSIMSDPSMVSGLISLGRAEFTRCQVVPVRERLAAEPTEETSKELATLEKELIRFDRLTKFLVLWAEEEHPDSTQDFSQYLQAQEKIASKNSVDSLLIRDANDLAFGDKPYSLNQLAISAAQAAAQARITGVL